MTIKNKLALLLTCLLVNPVFSGTITQVKNNKVLIDFNNEAVNVGDQFFILNAENKKLAIVQITIAKNKKAIADILKGTALVGNTTALRTQNKNPQAEFTPKKNEATFIRHDLIQVALHLKYMMNTISTKQESGPPSLLVPETVTMTGNNIGLGASLDYPLFDFMKANGMISYEMLDVSGTAQGLSCDQKSSTNCTAKISYLSLSGLAKFDIVKSQLNIWAGVGGAFKIPLSKKSTALSEDNIQMAQTAIAAVGADYHLNNRAYLPISAEYHYSFNQSDTVPAINQINLIVGYGLKF